MFGYFKRRRRRRLRRQPPPAAWGALLPRTVPGWTRLTTTERTELIGHTHVLLHEKYWEGCGGLELTEEIRVTIAAPAALLLLNRETDYYPRLTSILVYPARYVVEATHVLPGGIVAEGEELRAGESWSRGIVVLSWNDARHSAVAEHDAHNVVLHEFAHQLDVENGAHEGTPRLPDRAMAAEWSIVFQEEYQRLIEDVRHRRRTVLRAYGTVSPAEFFAVATEAFFERAASLREHHPKLYGLLARYYCQDPAARRGAPRPGESPS